MVTRRGGEYTGASLWALPDADTLVVRARAIEPVRCKPSKRGDAVPVAADYPFLDIMWTMIVFFAWVIWFWMMITILMDVFRRDDIGGWGKAGWSVFLILLPFLGVFIYLIAEGKDMAERRATEAIQSRAAFDDYVRNVAASEGPASEVAKAKELLDSGAIDQAEFDQLKRKALAT